MSDEQTPDAVGTPQEGDEATEAQTPPDSPGGAQEDAQERQEDEESPPVSPGDAQAVGARIRELADASERAADEETEPETADEMMLVPCPLCTNAPGPLGALPIVLEQSPHTETCPDCKGWGKVLTGSMQAENVIGTCPGCQGSGHTNIYHVEPPAPPAPPVEPATERNGETLRIPVAPTLPEYSPPIQR